MYVKRLPVDYLKIDIEFVRDLVVNQASQEVVRAIVGLAQGFGQRTVAEGAEDDRTLELLRELGVDSAQGYHARVPAGRDVAARILKKLGVHTQLQAVLFALRHGAIDEP